MLLLLAFLLMLLPADPSLPFHTYVQIAIALAACRILFVRRRTAAPRDTRQAPVWDEPGSDSVVLRVTADAETETRGENALASLDAAVVSADVVRRLEIVSWLLLALALAPLATAFAWIDTPASVAAWRTLAALALLGYVALWLGERRAAAFAGAVALAALLALFVGRSAGVSPLRGFFLPLFHSPGAVSGFPEAATVIVAILPLALAAALNRCVEQDPGSRLRWAVAGVTVLLTAVLALVRAALDIRLLAIALLALVAGLVLLPAGRRIRKRAVTASVTAAVSGILLGSLPGGWRTAFAGLDRLLPERWLHPARLPLEAAPWGIGPGGYATALVAVRSGAEPVTTWFGGWLRGLAELGIGGLLYPAALVLVCLLVRPIQKSGASWVRVGLVLLAVLFLRDVFVGWCFFALSAAGWLVLVLVCSQAHPGTVVVSPLRQRIAFGILALSVVAVAGLSEVSGYLMAAPERSEQGPSPGGRYILAARLAPWESRPAMAAWRVLDRPSDPGSADAVRGRRFLARAVRLAPRDPDILLAQARGFLADGSFDRYVATLERAVGANARHVAAHQALADARESLGDLETALALRRRCADLEPEESAHRLALARLYEKQDRPESALREYRKVLHLDYAHDEARRRVQDLSARLARDAERGGTEPGEDASIPPRDGL